MTDMTTITNVASTGSQSCMSSVQDGVSMCMSVTGDRAVGGDDVAKGEKSELCGPIAEIVSPIDPRRAI